MNLTLSGLVEPLLNTSEHWYKAHIGMGTLSLPLIHTLKVNYSILHIVGVQ